MDTETTTTPITNDAITDAVNTEASTQDNTQTEQELVANQQLTKEQRKAEIRSKALAAAAKRESKLRAEQERFRNEQSNYKSLLEKLENDRRSIEEDKKQFYHWAKEARDNPIDWLKNNFQIDPERYYQRVMNDGKVTPEELLQRELQSTKSELEEMREWRKSFEEERKKSRSEYEAYIEKQKQEQAQAAQVRQYQQARQEFLSHITNNKNLYQDLLMYSEDDILNAAEKKASSLIAERDGDAESLTYKEIADALQQALAAHHDKIYGVRANRPVANSEAVKTVSADNTKPTAQAETSKQVPKQRRDHMNRSITLNSKMSERATIKSPKYEDIKQQLKDELMRQG